MHREHTAIAVAITYDIYVILLLLGDCLNKLISQKIEFPLFLFNCCYFNRFSHFHNNSTFIMPTIQKKTWTSVLTCGHNNELKNWVPIRRKKCRSTPLFSRKKPVALLLFHGITDNFQLLLRNTFWLWKNLDWKFDPGTTYAKTVLGHNNNTSFKPESTPTFAESVRETTLKACVFQGSWVWKFLKRRMLV